MVKTEIYDPDTSIGAVVGFALVFATEGYGPLAPAPNYTSARVPTRLFCYLAQLFLRGMRQ